MKTVPERQLRNFFVPITSANANSADSYFGTRCMKSEIHMPKDLELEAIFVELNFFPEKLGA